MPRMTTYRDLVTALAVLLSLAIVLVASRRAKLPRYEVDGLELVRALEKNGLW